MGPSTMPRPLALTDDQLAQVYRCAEPLNPHDRGAYLKTVAELLNGHVLGDGVVARAAAMAQAKYLHPPEITLPGKHGR
jgi:hypothetical protein